MEMESDEFWTQHTQIIAEVTPVGTPGYLYRLYTYDGEPEMARIWVTYDTEQDEYVCIHQQGWEIIGEPSETTVFASSKETDHSKTATVTY